MIDGRHAIQAIIVREMGKDYSFHAAHYFTHGYDGIDAAFDFSQINSDPYARYRMLKTFSSIRQCFGFPKYPGLCCATGLTA